MLELYQTPLDILYFSLTVVIALLGVLLALLLIHFIRILSNIRTISEKTKDTIDLINHYLWQPIKIMMQVVEKGKEYAAKKHKN